MYPKMIAKQIVDFNKAAFDNTFDAITVLQDQTEKMVNHFLQMASVFPPEGKKVIAEWMEAYKKGKKDFKESVDNSFKTVDGFFIDSGDAKCLSIFGIMGKIDQSIKEVADDIIKSPIEVVGKSVPAKVTVADTNVKQSAIKKKKVIVEGQSRTGSVKATRKAAKSVKK